MGGAIADPSRSKSDPARMERTHPTASPQDDPIAAAARNWIRSGWTSATNGMAAVVSVMRVRQLLLAQVEDVLRPFELTFARYEVLMLLVLSRTGELPLATVRSRLQVHPASITGLITRLERDGLITRSTDPTDRRARRVTISDCGRIVALDATRLLNEAVFGVGWLAGPGGQSLLQLLKELRQAYGDGFELG